MSRYSILAFGGLAYVAFHICFLGFSARLFGFIDPAGNDAPSWALALSINLGLVLLFGATHSAMARDGFKRRLTRIVPVAAERSIYVLQSSFFLGLVVVFWQPIPGLIWSVAGPTALALTGLSVFGLVIVVLSTFQIGHCELFGLSQIWHNFRGTKSPPAAFRTPLLYRIVRHPMQTGVLIALFATPDMTVDRMALAVSLGTYVLIGLHFEERALRREFGAVYASYACEVPMLVPRLRLRRVSAPKATT